MKIFIFAVFFLALIKSKGMSSSDFYEIDGCLETSERGFLESVCSYVGMKNTIRKLSTSTEELEISNSYQNILDYPEVDLSRLYYLRKLSLKNSSIIFIKGKAFSGLTRLEHLGLEGNLLWYLDPLAFSEIPQLKSLDLTSNHFTRVRDVAYGVSPLKKLKMLVLDSNEEIKELEYDEFHVFPGNSIEYLSLKNCKISTLYPDSLVSFKKLESLDLSNNAFESDVFNNLTLLVKKMKILKLSLSKTKAFEFYPSAFFDGISRSTVQDIDLSNNDFPTIYATKEIFLDLSYLNLRSCKIRDIYEGAFNTFPNLESLDLAENPITSFPIQTFKLYNLELLNMSNRPDYHKVRIEFVDYAFSNLTYLKLLNISTFRINSVIKENTFNQLFFLKVLDLTKCSIQRIEAYAFKTLNSLEVLYLKGNLISSLEPFTLEGLSSLTTLVLCHNKLTWKDPSYSFDLVPNLGTLKMANNSITNLPPDLAMALPNLTVLDLSGNQILPWNRRVFQNNHLQTLLLSANKLNNVTTSMMQDFQDLSVLDISYNYFLCRGCAMSRFAYWLNSTSTSIVKLHDPSAYLCQLPEGLNGTKIHEAHFPKNICKEKLISKKVLIALLGALVLLIALLILGSLLILLKIYRKRRLRKKAEPKFDAFVSYDPGDRVYAVNNLIPYLEDNKGYKVGIIGRDIVTGASPWKTKRDAISSSRKTLLVVSSAMTTNQFFLEEMNYMADNLQQNSKQSLVIINIGDVDLSNVSEKWTNLLKSKDDYIELKVPEASKSRVPFLEIVSSALGEPMSRSRLEQSTFPSRFASTRSILGGSSHEYVLVKDKTAANLGQSQSEKQTAYNSPSLEEINLKLEEGRSSDSTTSNFGKPSKNQKQARLTPHESKRLQKESTNARPSHGEMNDNKLPEIIISRTSTPTQHQVNVPAQESLRDQMNSLYLKLNVGSLLGKNTPHQKQMASASQEFISASSLKELDKKPDGRKPIWGRVSSVFGKSSKDKKQTVASPQESVGNISIEEEVSKTPREHKPIFARLSSVFKSSKKSQESESASKTLPHENIASTFDKDPNKLQTPKSPQHSNRKPFQKELNEGRGNRPIGEEVSTLGKSSSKSQITKFESKASIRENFSGDIKKPSFIGERLPASKSSQKIHIELPQYEASSKLFTENLNQDSNISTTKIRKSSPHETNEYIKRHNAIQERPAPTFKKSPTKPLPKLEKIPSQTKLLKKESSGIDYKEEVTKSLENQKSNSEKKVTGLGGSLKKKQQKKAPQPKTLRVVDNDDNEYEIKSFKKQKPTAEKIGKSSKTEQQENPSESLKKSEYDENSARKNLESQKATAEKIARNPRKSSKKQLSKKSPRESLNYMENNEESIEEFERQKPIAEMVIQSFGKSFNKRKQNKSSESLNQMEHDDETSEDFDKQSQRNPALGKSSKKKQQIKSRESFNNVEHDEESYEDFDEKSSMNQALGKSSKKQLQKNSRESLDYGDYDEELPEELERQTMISQKFIPTFTKSSKNQQQKKSYEVNTTIQKKNDPSFGKTWQEEVSPNSHETTKQIKSVNIGDSGTAMDQGHSRQKPLLEKFSSFFRLSRQNEQQDHQTPESRPSPVELSKSHSSSKIHLK